MDNPLISVVIPLFNKEQFIESTLRSVVNQRYDNIELIIIDDGSTDASLAKVRTFLKFNGARFVNVSLQTRPNTGQTRARQDGIDSASGEYIAFLDSDDVWHPDKILLQVKMMANNSKLDMVFCNYMMLYSRKKLVKAVRFNPIEKRIMSWLLISGFGGALESTALIRKSILEQANGFDQRLQMSGGLDLAFRLSKNQSVGLVDDYLCGYRVIRSGWHNNKMDLRRSYDELLLKMELYSTYRDKIVKNLKIHLTLWELRNSFSLQNLFRLFIILLKSPISSLVYIWATLTRNLMAVVRGCSNIQSSSELLKLADL